LLATSTTFTPSITIGNKKDKKDNTKAMEALEAEMWLERESEAFSCLALLNFLT
jgi:hypothetical protein